MAGMTTIVQQERVDRYYPQGQLKDKRRNFLRSCNYAMFRRLTRSGEIDQHLETNANDPRWWRGTPDRPSGTHRGSELP